MNEEIEYLRKVYQSEETSTWINKLQMKNIVDYADKLQSNWNSLRELIEQYLENEKYSYISDNPKDRCRYDVFMEIKDKMNELEGKIKNENN